MWDDEGFGVDARIEAREEAADEAAFDEHDLNHDSTTSPVEGCSWCADEVGEEASADSADHTEEGEAA